MHTDGAREEFPFDRVFATASSAASGDASVERAAAAACASGMDAFLAGRSHVTFVQGGKGVAARAFGHLAARVASVFDDEATALVVSVLRGEDDGSVTDLLSAPPMLSAVGATHLTAGQDGAPCAPGAESIAVTSPDSLALLLHVAHANHVTYCHRLAAGRRSQPAGSGGVQMLILSRRQQCQRRTEHGRVGRAPGAPGKGESSESARLVFVDTSASSAPPPAPSTCAGASAALLACVQESLSRPNADMCRGLHGPHTEEALHGIATSFGPVSICLMLAPR